MIPFIGAFIKTELIETKAQLILELCNMYLLLGK